jgi:hypothetical protein
MATAAYISGMQKIASLVSQKNPVVEQRFLEFFQDDGNSGVAPDLRPATGKVGFNFPICRLTKTITLVFCGSKGR